MERSAQATDLRLSTAERAAILRALEACGGSMSKAAGELCISLTGLRRKMDDHGLPRARETRSWTDAGLNARERDFLRADRSALRRKYYAFLRETGRVSHEGEGVEAKARSLLSEFNPPAVGEPAAITELRKLHERVTNPMRILSVGGAR